MKNCVNKKQIIYVVMLLPMLLTLDVNGADISTTTAAIDQELATIASLWQQCTEEINTQEINSDELVTNLQESQFRVISIAIDVIQKKFSDYYSKFRNPWYIAQSSSGLHQIVEIKPLLNRILLLLSASGQHGNSPCAIRVQEAGTLLDEDMKAQLSAEELSRPLMQLVVCPSCSRLSPTLFFPGPAELVLARILACIGHELGHVLYHYTDMAQQEKCGPPTREAMYSKCITLLGVMSMCGTLIGGVALDTVYGKGERGLHIAVATVLMSVLAATVEARQDNRSQEYTADVIGLKLMPPALRYGSIVALVEFMCYDNIASALATSSTVPVMKRIMTKIKHWAKCCTSSDYAIHPALIKRLDWVVQTILASEPDDEKTKTLDALQQAAQKALDNYWLQYTHDPTHLNNPEKLIPLVHRALEKTRTEVEALFIKIRGQQI